MRSRRPPKRSAWPTAAAVVVLPLAVAGAVSLRSAGGSDTSAASAAAPAREAVSSFAGTVPNRTPPPVAPAPKGMVWIPGGEFSMGAADPPSPDDNDTGMHATTDSRPIHRVYVDGFWMDRTETTNAQFAQFVEATGYVTVAERRRFPGCAAGEPGGRRGRLHASASRGAARYPLSLVELPEGRELAASARSRQLDRRQGSVPGRARRLRGCARVRNVGGQTRANRGRVGIRRPRRSLRKRLSVGQHIPAGRKMDGEQSSGTFPERGHGPGRVRRSRAGGEVSGERVRALRRRRRRVGVGQRLVPT